MSLPTDNRSGRVRVHVQESKNSLDQFRVTRERFAPALAAHPAVAARLDLSFGADRAGLDAGLADAEILVAGNFEGEDLRRRAPSLRWVQSIFAGVEKLVPIIPDDVVLTNASGVHAPKAAEFAISAILMLNGAIPQLMRQQRERVWQAIFTSSLAGKTVVIVGTGALGVAAATPAAQFGMRVLGVSRSGAPVAPFASVSRIGDLHAVLPEADFLIVTLPLTPETRGLIGAAVFAGLKPGAGFISIGRGPVVDEDALVAALGSGHLGGAVLDVFAVEPLPAASPLWSFDNVVIVPHCGVDDLDAYLPRALDLFLGNVARYLDGAELRNVVQRHLGY